MKILNIHERSVKVSPGEAGRAIDGLSGREDFLWPRSRWPAMEFDGPLAVGASGGHGPVRYAVFIEPLHDALLEDTFAGAERTLVNAGAKMPRWNPWVRFLRWRLERRRKKARSSVSA